MLTVLLNNAPDVVDKAARWETEVRRRRRRRPTATARCCVVTRRVLSVRVGRSQLLCGSAVVLPHPTATPADSAHPQVFMPLAANVSLPGTRSSYMAEHSIADQIAIVGSQNSWCVTVVVGRQSDCAAARSSRSVGVLDAHASALRALPPLLPTLPHLQGRVRVLHGHVRVCGSGARQGAAPRRDARAAGATGCVCCNVWAWVWVGGVWVGAELSGCALTRARTL